jgi:hypothetical protein
MQKTLVIRFGILSPSIADQLKEQGFDYSVKTVESIQSDKDCLSQLYISGVVNDKEYTNIKVKIFTRLRSHICRKNNLSTNAATSIH